MSEGLVFEDPPPPGVDRKPRMDIARIVKELRRNPGRWARLAMHPGSVPAAAQRYGLELVCRQGVVYGRWSA